jgi:hypothetical protein
MKWWKRVLFILTAVFIGIQFVRPPRVNPLVVESQTLYANAQVPADVHAILDRSCSDCHSNKTVWPWYSQIAPVSWLLADDVKKGRKEMNLSEWGTYKPKRKTRKLGEVCDQVKDKEMPLTEYTLLHPSAKLSDADRARLCAWTEMLGGKS